ncbi:MAG: aminotransferase class IV [Deltaproteobacteria bacterium]|nr:aminotransferase class IV [Deltaproteobacteria bacterium]
MARTAPLLWLDGAMIPSADASVPLMAHAPQRGSLVFDVGSFHRTARGVALFRVREHVVRFLSSARIVGLEIAASEDALVEAAALVTRAAKAEEGLIRWSAFFDAATPDLLPRSAKARVAVAAQIPEDPPRTSPMRIAIFDDARKAAPDALSPEAKAAAAYLGPMIARRRAVARGDDDVVLLDHEGNVAEAPIANIFFVHRGVLRTPALGKILPGITRDAVLAIAKAEGVPTREERISVAEALAADEAFLTATSFPVAPIGTVNGTALAGAPGPITKRLQDRLVRAQRGEDAAFAAWCTTVARDA